MNNESTASKSVIINDQLTNVSSFKFNFNVGKVAGPGFEVNDLNGGLEVAVTDRNTEIQTNGVLRFFDQIHAGEIVNVVLTHLTEAVKNQERRRQDRFDAEMKENEARRKEREEDHAARMTLVQKETEYWDAKIAKLSEKDAE